MPKVIVVGASGFAGALTANLLWRHPSFELAAITARSDIGRLDELYPRYRVPLEFQQFNPNDYDHIDAAVVAYPHVAAAPVVAGLLERGARVVDLSADCRLNSLPTYERWYGQHPYPELLDRASYGLTELNRSAIKKAALIACPGCFPTATLLALAPLARAGLIDDVVVDAKTGISGAGRSVTATTHYSSAASNVTPYGVANHRHRPEIEEQLALLGSDVSVQFQPHLVPVDQGELVSCYITTTRPVPETELRDHFDQAYDNEPFIELVDRPPTMQEVQQTNFCRIFTTVDDHTGKVLVFAAIDNLWKGTASQAVQNLNLMFGFDERSGLA